MIKPCIILDGKIINVGEWDYQEIGSPLPIGAIEEEREFDFSDDRGWFEIGAPQELSEIEQLKTNNQILAQSIYDLTNIIEVILLGGIE
jgi:hypothetical protein